jgi:hypothetical protein
MHRLALWLLLVANTACIVSRSSKVVREAVWAQPGAGPVFAWMARETTTKVKSLESEHDSGDLFFESSTSTRTTRTWVIAIDPATGRSRQLGWTSAAARPFYWDERRSVLWVQDAKDQSIIGLTPTGVTWVGGQWATFYAEKDLPVPFAMTADYHRDVRLYNARTDTELELSAADADGTGRLDGELLRLVRSSTEGLSLLVEQTVIDWSAGKPVRMLDVVWRSPPLDPAVGTRLATLVTADGHQLVEVTEGSGGALLVVHDLLGGTPARVTRLQLAAGEAAADPATSAAAPGTTDAADDASAAAPSKPASRRKLSLYSIDRDVVLVVEKEPEGPCLRGQVATLSTGTVTAIAEDLCVTGVETIAGSPRAWVKLGGEHRFAYVNAGGGLVAIDAEVRDAVGIQGATIAISTAGSKGNAATEVLQLDLAAATVTPLGSLPAGASLLGVQRGQLVFLADGKVATRPLAAAADEQPRSIALPTRVSDQPEGMPAINEIAGIGERPERTKLWLGFGWGVNKDRHLAFDGWVQLRRWWSRRMSWSAGAGLLAEFGDGGPAGRLDTRVDLGVRLYKDRALGGWFIGAAAGGSRSDLRRDKMVISSSYQATGSLRLGWQGRLFNLEAAAIAPSLFDPDRGVLFVAGLGIGLYGANL